MKLFFAKLVANLALILSFVLISAQILHGSFEPVWFLILTGTVFALIFYIDHLIDRHFAGNADKKTAESKTGHGKIATPVDTDSREYRLCRFIWLNSVLFCRQITPSPSPKCNAYLWTAFFYAITKEIRDQEIVDGIYARFRDSALPFLKEAHAPDIVIDDMQSHYRKFREILNATRIDPRSEDGILALWSLTSALAFPDIQLPDNALSGFKGTAKMIVKHAASLYRVKENAESTYYMETASGLVIRVPGGKLDAWQAAQEEMHSNPESVKLTPAEEEAKRKILDNIYGTDRNGGNP